MLVLFGEHHLFFRHKLGGCSRGSGFGSRYTERSHERMRRGRWAKQEEKRTKNHKKIVRDIRHNNVQSGWIRDNIDKIDKGERREKGKGIKVKID